MTRLAKPNDVNPSGRAPRLDVAFLEHIPSVVLLVLIVGLAALVCFATFPPKPLILHVLQKLAHPGVFGVISLSAFTLVSRNLQTSRATWLAYLLALLTAIMIGGLTEIGQIYTHREPGLHDVWVDTRGALCALLFAAAFDARLRITRPAVTRAVVLTIAGLLSTVILWPLLYSGAAYLNRAYRFPVLFTPVSVLDTFFLEPTPLQIQIADEHFARALVVPLKGHPYAGVTLFEPSSDWRGYTTLVIDATNPSTRDVDIVVRVDDRGRTLNYDDRYNVPQHFAAGEHKIISIPLDDIAHAPQTRILDLGRISQVILFHVGASGPPTLLLHQIRLS